MTRCVRMICFPCLVLFLSVARPALSQSRPVFDALPSADWIGALLQTRGFSEDGSRPVLDEIAQALRSSATRPSDRSSRERGRADRSSGGTRCTLDLRDAVPCARAPRVDSRLSRLRWLRTREHPSAEEAAGYRGEPP